MNRREFYHFIFNDKEKDLKKIAIINENLNLTYAQFQEEIKHCSNILKKYSVKSGTKIGLIIGDHASFLSMLMAGYLVDATVIPIYVNVGEEKLCQIIRELNVNILISDKEIRGHVKEKFSCMQKELFLSTEAKHRDDLDDDIVLIMMTSGTTNKPKGVMLSTGNISTNVLSICEYLKLVENDKVLIVKNTNHISTIVGEMLVGLYMGVTLIFNSNMIRMVNLDCIIEQYGATVFFAVPSLLQRMLQNEKKEQDTLRIINFYGSKISEADIRFLLKKYPKINFIYSYGQTEASPRVTYIERDDIERYMGSSGRTIRGVTVMIKDEKGNVLGPNEEGEIVVSGPNIMRGYYNNKFMTEKVIIDGLLHTGDFGYVNEEGYLFVTGRRDNMIIISGKNIHPEEIEEIISEYEGVVEVLVEEKKYGGINGLVCYIVKNENSEIEPKDILHFVRAKVEDYKTPREIIFVSELEKTPSGKIKRNCCTIR